MKQKSTGDHFKGTLAQVPEQEAGVQQACHFLTFIKEKKWYSNRNLNTIYMYYNHKGEKKDKGEKEKGGNRLVMTCVSL